MRNNVYFLGLIVFGTLINACDSDSIERQEEFDISQNRWLDFKSESKNSYTYTVRNSSWAGFSSETSIFVENGIVTQRDFELILTDNTTIDILEEDQQWSETLSEIGSHPNGAEAITLDEIYTKAENNWLVERNKTTIYFETDNDGMISLCGFVENNCIDDCFIGVQIISIESL